MIGLQLELQNSIRKQAEAAHCGVYMKSSFFCVEDAEHDKLDGGFSAQHHIRIINICK